MIPGKIDFPVPTPYYQAALRPFEELEMPYLDARYALDLRDYETSLEDDFHWNNAGHQKVGNMLSACIEAFQISRALSDCEQVKMP